VRVEFARSGKVVQVDAPDMTILEIALEKAVEIPHDCEVGVCGTCKVLLLSGEVEMDTEDGLDEEDREEGYILACVSRPLTNAVIDA